MEFIIEDNFFDFLPDLCIGIVMVSGIDNRGKKKRF